jgi:hypothetical protein
MDLNYTTANPVRGDKTMSKITDSVLSLSTKIMEGLDLDTKTGVAKEKSETSLYDANLPEGVKPETVEVIKNYDADFVAASAHALWSDG